MTFSAAPVHSHASVLRMKISQGFPRLGITLAAAWFVVWTCAYVYTALIYEVSPSAALITIRVAVVLALIATAAFCVRWIVAGFRAA